MTGNSDNRIVSHAATRKGGGMGQWAAFAEGNRREREDGRDTHGCL